MLSWSLIIGVVLRWWLCLGRWCTCTIHDIWIYGFPRRDSQRGSFFCSFVLYPAYNLAYDACVSFLCCSADSCSLHKISSCCRFSYKLHAYECYTFFPFCTSLSQVRYSLQGGANVVRCAALCHPCFFGWLLYNPRPVVEGWIWKGLLIDQFVGGPASGDMVQAATPVYTIEGPFCSSFAFASSRQSWKGLS